MVVTFIFNNLDGFRLGGGTYRPEVALTNVHFESAPISRLLGSVDHARFVRFCVAIFFVFASRPARHSAILIVEIGFILIVSRF